MALSFNELSGSMSADGTANTSGAAASMLNAAAVYTIPANWWTVGKRLNIKASGRISNVNPTPGTARYDLRFGATIVWDSLAILLDTTRANTTVHWQLELELTCRAIGAAANLWGWGRWTSIALERASAAPPYGHPVAALPWNSTPAVGANFDSTASQTVDVFFTQTAATGTHTCHTYSVQLFNI